MTKSTKIMLAVIGSVLAVCIIVVAVVSIAGGESKSDSGTDPAVITTGNVVSDAPDQSETQDAQTTQAQSTDPSQTTTEPVVQLKDQLIGKWADSANMSGYEFFENGTVTVTYVNLTVPIINMPINGTATGSYALDGNKLTVKYSIYKRTITDSFTASVENNTLTLKDNDSGDVSTYARSSGTTPSNAATADPAATGTGIVGTWVNSEGSVRYIFNENGTVKISYSNAYVPSISPSALSSSYTGVYLTNGDKITIQFTVNSQKITQEYNFTVVGNAMSITDASGDSTIFVRGGSNFKSTDADDLIGTWMDGNGMSGYEFKRGSDVEITYVNFTLPVINMPINGTYSGTYSVSGNRLTVRASIYSNTIVDTYTFEITGNTLTLTNTDSGEISTYIKK